jgi:outer membrane protein OmpA-like peptidoglycan-associated protein
MASMLAELRRLVTPELLSEVTRHTYESEAAMSKACDAAIPAFAATIANRSDDHGFIKQLMNLATGAVDRDPIETARRIASSPAGTEVNTAATGWLSTLFGPNLSAVTSSIARYAGIRDSSVSSLLMTTAPLVLGYFGRLIRGHNLSAADVAERLRAERPHIEAAMPAGFEMPGFVRKPYETRHAAVDEPVSWREPRREKAENWGFPLAALLAALGIGGLLWWGVASSRHRDVARVNVEQTAPSGAVGTTGTVTPPPARSTPTTPRVTFPAGSMEDRLSKYLASPGTGSMNIDLDRVQFESGSSTLTSRSQAQIENLGVILRSYPNATVVVAGHTDNRGNAAANDALSRSRAEAVAKVLTDNGVKPDHVRAEGNGSREPVADNATASGRQQNRRVTVVVSR